MKEVKLSKKFKKIVEEHGLTDLEVCIEAINHYIEFINLPSDYFENEIENPIKFQYFTNFLRNNYTIEERTELCHPIFFKQLQKHGIKDDEVLHWYIWEFLGFNVSRKPICKLYAKDFLKYDYPHCAPFDYVSDTFFERVRNSIAFASRTSGKTQLVAIINHLDMTFKKGCDIASAGAIIKQADRVYKYFLDFHKHPVLKNLYLKEPVKTETLYKNGSKLEIITGTKTGLNCYSDDTEVLTNRGWKLFKDLDNTEEIFSLNPKTLIPEWSTYNTKFEWDYKGEMLHFFNDIFDILVTPNHNMFTSLDVLDPLSLMEANKLENKEEFILMNYLPYLKPIFNKTFKEIFKGEDLKKIPYDGKVYCVNLDKNHVLLTRRKGKCTWQGQSPHPSKARIDEVELMDWDVLQEGLSMVQSKMTSDGKIIAGSLSLLSSRKFSSGTFQRVLDNAEESGSKIYCWCVWDVLEKCTRKCQNDPEHGDCPILQRCKGFAHNCDGFYKVSDFIDKARLLSNDTFEAQWLNKRPSQESVVYAGYYDLDKHILPVDTKPEGEHMLIMSAIDFGSSPGHDFVYQKHWVDYSELIKALELDNKKEDEELKFRLKFYLFYEYRSACGTMAKHSIKIRNSPYFDLGEIIFADPSAKQSRIDLYDLYNINTYSAINAVEDGIDLVRSHLETYQDYTDNGNWKSHFYIIDGYLDSEDNLMGTDKEFLCYRYSTFKDGKVNRRSPLKVYDHGMDCVRYIIQSAYPVILEKAVPVYEHIENHGFWG